VRAGLAAGENRRILRLHGYQLEVRQPRPADLADARDGAASADAGDEDVEPPTGVVPDLLRRGAAMDLRIRRVLELLRHHGAGDLPDEFLGPRHGALHALGPRGEHELGPEKGQHLAPLDGHGLRHDQDQPIAPRCRDESERDARVAGGRLDERRAGADAAVGLHGVDHRHADAVLDAGDRVEELELQQDLGVDAALPGHALEAHEGRVADGVGDGPVDVAAARTVGGL
jgi:hypothetical protein